MMKNKKAFTLVELIVSMAVAAVVGLLAISIALGVVDVWSKAGDRVTSNSEVQYALDAIANDLESAFFRERGETMFAVTALHSADSGNSGLWIDASAVSRPSTTEPFDPSEDQYGWGGCWIRFFTAAPGLNAVGYQLIRTPIIGASTDVRYNLYRAAVRMDHTVSEGFDITIGEYSDNTASRDLGHPVEVIAPRVENILLSNVIDFGIRLYVYEEVDESSEGDDSPQGLRIIFPADGSNTLDDTDDEHLANTREFGASYDNTYPQAAEIVIRLLTEEGWEELRALEESGGPAEDWQRIVDRNSTVYRRFVDMRGEVFSG